MIYKFKQLLELFPDLILGGSASLILRGFSLERAPKDLDIICDKATFDKINALHFLENVSQKTCSSDMSFSASFRRDEYTKEEKVDFVIRESPEFEVLDFCGNIYKVEKLQTILSYKMKYALSDIESAVKHRLDLAKIFLQLQYNPNLSKNLTQPLYKPKKIMFLEN